MLGIEMYKRKMERVRKRMNRSRNNNLLQTGLWCLFVAIIIIIVMAI